MITIAGEREVSDTTASRGSAAHQQARASATYPGSFRVPAWHRVQGLFEPVLRVGLVVERGDLAVAGGAVEADRLGQGAVGLQPDGARPAGPRLGFQAKQ